MKHRIQRRSAVAVGAAMSVAAVVAAVIGPASSGARTVDRLANTAGVKVAHAAPSTKGVTLRVGDQAGTGAEAVLKAAHLLSKLPFKVTFADFTSGPPLLQAMAAGDVDVGGVGDAPPVFANPTAKLAIVGATKTSTRNSALLVPGNSSITSIHDLVGKTIAVAEGSSADYHILTVLNKAGIKPSQVKLDFLQPADALAALQAGQVDAWDVWTPYIEQAVAQNGDKILVGGGPGYGSPYAYQVASEKSLADPKKVAAIQVYLKTLDQGYLWVDKHSSAWAKTWAAATGLPLSVMDQAAADDPINPVPVTSTVVQQEQGLVNAFATAGEIPEKYNFAPFVTDAFASAVAAARAAASK